MTKQAPAPSREPTRAHKSQETKNRRENLLIKNLPSAPSPGTIRPQGVTVVFLSYRDIYCCQQFLRLKKIHHIFQMLWELGNVVKVFQSKSPVQNQSFLSFVAIFQQSLVNKGGQNQTVMFLNLKVFQNWGYNTSYTWSFKCFRLNHLPANSKFLHFGLPLLQQWSSYVHL